MISLFALAFTSCEDDESSSFTTSYPLITVNGGDEIVKMGDSYSDAGATATVDGADTPLDIDNPVNTGVPGFYTVTYTATNADGFSRSETRTVIVYEPGDITGLYQGRRIGRSGGAILITSAGGDMYNISDAHGGHYEFDRGLGAGFAAPFTTTLNADNTFEPANTFNGGFGLAVEVSNGVRSADGSTWNWDIYFPAVDFGFPVELTKTL